MKTGTRLSILFTFLSAFAVAQTKTQKNPAPPQGNSGPKIIIGMMVDQMRWDYLYRFKNRYSEGGFKRLLREGFSCENTMIDYSPTITACGHTCVYTGSVPAIHGIVGNGWYSREKGKSIGCVDDETTKTVGTLTESTGQSPHNNLTTTITDQLRIATNYQSKTVGIAIKDRAAILPGGHAANAAFWFDSKAGGFITSTYYMNELPGWVKQFNDKKIIDSYFENDWNTLYPIQTYSQSTPDDKAYENTTNGDAKPVFPHLLKQFKGKNYGAVRATPYGNTLTFAFAKAAIEGYELGRGAFTDFLAISFSSPDAIGHTYGPNSIEQEDDYLRLDKDLADFFSYLDKRFGKGNYLYFITADHAVSESPGYLLENKMPGGVINEKDFDEFVKGLKEKYNLEKPVLSFDNYQLYMNWDEFDKKGINHSEVEQYIINGILQIKGIANVIPTRSLGTAAIPDRFKSMLINGYNIKRSGDFDIIPEPGWKNGSIKGATHGTMYPYDAHIPLVWMGWKIKPGYTNRVTGMTDIAPTLAALLHIQMPSGCVGKPITEITEK